MARITGVRSKTLSFSYQTRSHCPSGWPLVEWLLFQAGNLAPGMHSVICLIDTTDIMNGEWVLGRISGSVRRCDQVIYGCQALIDWQMIRTTWPTEGWNAWA